MNGWVGGWLRARLSRVLRSKGSDLGALLERLVNQVFVKGIESQGLGEMAFISLSICGCMRRPFSTDQSGLFDPWVLLRIGIDDICLCS